MRKRIKKVKPPSGTYVSRLSDEQCNKLQKLRAVFLLIGHALFVVGLFIRQDCMNHVVEIQWLLTLYLLVMFALIAVFVWAGVFTFRSGKIGRSISEKVVPKKRGLDSVLTFDVLELQFALSLVLFGIQIGCVAVWYDVGGLVITLISGCVAVAMFGVRLVTVKAWRNNTEYRPPEKTEIRIETDEEIEDFYADAQPADVAQDEIADFYRAEDAASDTEPPEREEDA